MQEHMNIFTNTHTKKTYMLKMHLTVDSTVHLHMTQTHTKLMNRNTAQLVLLQDFPLLPSCLPAFLRTSFSNTFFLVSFFCLEEEKQAAFTMIYL